MACAVCRSPVSLALRRYRSSRVAHAHARSQALATCGTVRLRTLRSYGQFVTLVNSISMVGRRGRLGYISRDGPRRRRRRAPDARIRLYEICHAMYGYMISCYHRVTPCVISLIWKICDEPHLITAPRAVRGRNAYENDLCTCAKAKLGLAVAHAMLRCRPHATRASPPPWRARADLPLVLRRARHIFFTIRHHDVQPRHARVGSS